ncbi:MAG: hypothetical protein K2H03_04540 [Muribaculaceae bacterium]|nr:hypothetical protein [Muribaculaceae bacterium]
MPWRAALSEAVDDALDARRRYASSAAGARPAAYSRSPMVASAASALTLSG